MAIPTITLLNPDNGLAYGEYYITIVGTNFRTPDLISGDVKQESVRVFFDGIQVDEKDVYVRSDTEVDVRVPVKWIDPFTTAIPLSVDIMVQNIDATKTPIPGEEAFLIDGFSYTKWELDDGKFVDLIWRRLSRYLNSVLNCRVTGKVHPDYNLESTEFVPDPPEDPSIYLIGPRRMSNGDATEKAMWFMEKSNSYKRLPKAFDFYYSIVGISTKKRILDILSEQFEDVIRKSPVMYISFDGEDYEVPIFCTQPPATFNEFTGNSNLLQFQAEIKLRGVPAFSDKLWRTYDSIDEIDIII